MDDEEDREVSAGWDVMGWYLAGCYGSGSEVISFYFDGVSVMVCVVCALLKQNLRRDLEIF